jgi:hypothetical protein
LPGDINYQKDRGFIGVYNETDTAVVKIASSTSSGSGIIRTFGPDGSLKTNLTTSGGNAGYIGLDDSNNTTIVVLTDTQEGGGYMGTWGTNGNHNCKITSLEGYPNNGYISVHINDITGHNEKAGMYVNASGEGEIFADVKNFRVDYPGRDNEEIWYACIEGPEAAAYLRGTAKLEDGKSFIDFPEHFKYVISDKNMTVMLTPLSADSKGLAVVKKNTEGFEVVELLKGKGNYEFDWEVKAVRKGYEDYRVIRNKSEARPAGPAAMQE